MRRKEKLYVMISFVVGTCLFFISLAMIFCNIRKIRAEEKQQVEIFAQEKGDHANSWRYEDGKLKENTGDSTNRIGRNSRSSKTVQPIIPKSATALGIDVSHNQGEIDWQAVKNSGKVDFVIIRCGYGMNQTNQDDQYWEYNTSECERLGIPYGVYLYSYATDKTRAESEADHVIRLLENKTPVYPVYYDLEDNTQEKLTTSQLNEIASVFFNKMKKAGYSNLGTYANLNWFNSKLTGSVFNQYPKWIAQYNSTCTYSKSYHMWQYTNLGSLAGIKTKVDFNYKIGSWGAAPLTTGIKMNKKNIGLINGKSQKAGIEVYSTSNIWQQIQWKTSNTKIAVVNNQGVITAKSAGKATITAMTFNGKKASCTVTVKPKTNKIKKLKKSGKKSIKITWTKVSGTTKYQIYMSTKKKSGYKKIKTASAKSSTYTKGKLKKGKRYYFKVRSCKKVGGKYYYSAFSAVKSIKR